MSQRCAVPFCYRTTKRDYSEWLCGEHYRLADKRLRRLRARLWRKIRDQDKTLCSHVILNKLEAKLWSKAVRQAIERAVGITA